MGVVNLNIKAYGVGMSRKRILTLFFLLTIGVSLVVFFWPAKDYKKLALGKWYESESGLVVDVEEEVIIFAKGKRKEKIYYNLLVDKKPMEIEVWRNQSRREVYRGTIIFKNDDEVIAKKIPDERDQENYMLEMLARVNFIWKRVK